MQIIKINNISDFDNFGFFDSDIKRKCVTVLGFFDGVHLAHRKLILKAKELAKKKNIPLTVFTFSSDESGLKRNTSRLFTDKEKLDVFQRLNADTVLLVSFPAVSELSKEEFVRSILVEKLNTDTAVCGYNFSFGKGGVGRSEDLSAIMKKLGRDAFVLPEYTYNSLPVSSSLIRDTLRDKKLYEASLLLGEPYSITGTVSHGLGVGKKLGIPTVNLPLPSSRFSLPVGVYAGVLSVDGKIFLALANIGNCPTIKERETHLEAFILDFDGNLYGKEIKIYFLEYLREEKKFKSIEDLLLQINVDKKRALELIKEKKWQEIGPNLQ